MNFTLSAYNAIPADETQRHLYYQKLARFDWIDGLELSFGGSVVWPEGFDVNRPLPNNLVTMVGHNMTRVAESPNFGLASPDEDGRRRAIDDHRVALDEIAALKRTTQPVRAVEVHSAPTKTASKQAYLESLRELASWDWEGTQIWLEHCDAFVAGQTPAKGYLPLADEIAVLNELGDDRFGLVINWARSAIEGRSAQTALDHVRQAATSGWLRHVGIAGTAAEASDYGVAWADAHVPIAGTGAAPDSAILTKEAVRDALAAAGEVTVGLKFTLQPVNLGGEERAELLNELAHVTAAAR